MKQKKLMFNFFVNRNWSKLTDTRKRVKILADNRKSHHPIETLYWETGGAWNVLYLPAPLRGDGVSVTGVKVVAASVVVADVQENHKKHRKILTQITTLT